MKEYKNVVAAERPEDLEIDEFSVYIHDNITEVEVPGADDETTETHYQFDLTIYDKDEYILTLAQAQRESSLAMQLAQAEILDTILKGGV